MSKDNPDSADVEHLERLWVSLAEAIDRAGPAHERLFLAKLALLLGHRLDDDTAVATLIETALRDLD